MSKDEKSAFEGHYFPEIGEWSTLTITCSKADYSASRICRAVEDCDCHLLNLNVTSDTYGDDRPVVELRVSAANVISVCRSLERYGYEVLDMHSSSETLGDDTAAERLEELMRYLQV